MENFSKFAQLFGKSNVYIERVPVRPCVNLHFETLY